MVRPEAIARAFPQFSLPGRFRPWFDEALKYVRYQLVGMTNTIVSLAVLNIFFFLLPPTTKLFLILGSSVAYVAGDANSFFWNARWTFRAGRGNWRQVVRYVPLCVAGLLVNAAILWGASSWLLTLPLPSWLVGNFSQLSMGATGTIGYLVCRLWVFRS